MGGRDLEWSAFSKKAFCSKDVFKKRPVLRRMYSGRTRPCRLLTETFSVTFIRFCRNCGRSLSSVCFVGRQKYIISEFDVCWTVQHCDNWRIKNQLDSTYYFIVLLIGSKCFGHYYDHHQELATMMLITTLFVSFLVCCRLEVRCG